MSKHYKSSAASAVPTGGNGNLEVDLEARKEDMDRIAKEADAKEAEVLASAENPVSAGLDNDPTVAAAEDADDMSANNPEKDELTEQKVTAAEVENNCPADLQDLGKRIATHWEKACKAEEKADQHYRSIGQHLAEARKACDEGGFEAFREKFCPNLGRTRTYELLAVGQNKKSLEDFRASNRERAARHRAKKSDEGVVRDVTDRSDPPAEPPEGPAEVEEQAAAPVAVTDRSDPLPEPQDSPAEAGNGVGPPEQTPAPSQARSPAHQAKDDALSGFNETVLALRRRTKGQKVERFEKTSVSTEILEELGKFLVKLAEQLKANPEKSGTAKPNRGFVPQGNGDVPPQESGDARKTLNATLDAERDLPVGEA